VAEAVFGVPLHRQEREAPVKTWNGPDLPSRCHFTQAGKSGQINGPERVLSQEGWSGVPRLWQERSAVVPSATGQSANSAPPGGAELSAQVLVLQ